ncbi:class I SAM-dependent methyltransferase [Amphritea japonica]|uniref:23S rRNA (Cytosine1962-C5)-methyltransferase n=1 Tax=Amphritea japonica ATCC BAA-1530 TaxID=1278309 RepID=A0A7R6P3I8_9GAMM|nr:class I SAM-dependent methyltransferase [Amphritea japonica]BBB26538.1 23S rRNA (cytosine1962-C5)-methyltransferase [Amphritea japonica ATCC BAA-1530]
MQVIFDSISAQLASTSGEVRRLFHGRGRCFPGYEQLVIDLLPPVAVIRLFTEHPPELLEQLNQYFQQLDERVKPDVLVVQHRYRREGLIEVLWNNSEIDPEQLLQVKELGLSYNVRPLKNQNSGLFLDMREGRRWVNENSKGRNILNLFSYTCGFSVAAIAGGAERVVNLDMSRSALSAGRENHRLNQHPMEKVKFLSHDLFRSWGKLRREGPYDLVVIDPPSFQKGSFVATNDYRKVLKRLPELTKDQAEVLLCLNSPQLDSQFLIGLVEENCPEFVFIERINNPEDFPDQDDEQALKVLLFKKTG